MSARAGIWAILGTAGAVAFAAPAGAAFHVLLERSTPAAGDTLDAAPPEVALTFSGPIEQSGSSLTLLGPGGQARLLEGARRAGDPRTLAAPLPALAPGGYRIEWRVVSSDGHPIAGDFVFFVTSGEGAPLGLPPPPSDGAMHALGHDGEMGPGTSTGSAATELPSGAPSTQGPAHVDALLIAVRGGADLALLLAAGLLLFTAWRFASPTGAGPVPAAPGRADRAAREPTSATRAATGALVTAAPLLTAANAWLWAAEIVGPGAASGTRLDALTSLSSGRALLVEVALAALAAWALFLARRPRAASVFALAAVAAGGLAGHPASYTPSIAVPTSALHQLAAAAWAGGLLFLVTERAAPSFVDSLRHVSRVALVAVVAVAATGVVQTALLLGSPSRLLTTPYGLLVLAKLLGFLGLVSFGAYHRFRLIPHVVSAASGPHGRDALRAPSLALELALAVAVVVLAAVLSHIPPSS